MGREFRTAGVVGLGTMGSGIMEVLARGGLDVIAVEADEAGVQRGRAALSGSTQRAVGGGKLSAAERDALLGRVSFAVGVAGLGGVDLVIEAVPEQLEVKRRVFAELGEVCPDSAVLATGTSSLSVTEISVATPRPDRVVGLHFFNPAPVMKLVEVVGTVVTAPDVMADVAALCERLGKVAVTVGDRPGFIAYALLCGYLNHAATMLESGYASREDLDAAMRLGAGLPMGPLALMDLIGVDVAYEVLDTLYHSGRDPRHAPAPLIKQMVTAGLLGRKTGRGFYTYAQPGSPAVVPDEQTPAGGGPAEAGPPVTTIGVAGSGLMATGIAEVAARGGYQVIAVARSQDKAARTREAMTASLAKAAARGKITEADRDAALARVTWAWSLDQLSDADLVVEAIVEELTAKKAMFAALDEICKPTAVLATTTSSLPVIECAMATSRPAHVIGLHFFNPAPLMPLVEVVRTIRTSAETTATARRLCARLGKTGIVCAERAGFIVNALLFPYLNDAVRMLESSYATIDGIDDAMKLGCGYPMGPFQLLDIVGLDVSLAIERELYLENREPTLAPAPLLEHLVTAGYLGRKTGRGFRTYTSR